ncbi:hypothetical protein [Tsukamurella pseudospumae]|uniref:hypothetical protein n=1 Tax=Tsukamurella pseudospumae TaxID=239498 RepID=UPI001586DB86|nr:hypothetical protein [Tsukamurella pseudospumae]
MPQMELDQALTRSSCATAAIVRALKVANHIDGLIEASETLQVRRRDGARVELRFI